MLRTNRSRGSDYAARVHAEIVPELAAAARLKAGFFRPEFHALVLDALEASASIRQLERCSIWVVATRSWGEPPAPG